MIVELTLKHAMHVCRNLRASDAHLLEAARFDTDVDSYARERHATYGLRCAALAADGTPVGMGGLTLSSPGVWTAWVVGTPRWGERAIEIRRMAGRLIRRILESGAGHRVQAQALAADRKANAYLLRLGFTREGVMRAAGRHGEDFILYGLTRRQAWAEAEAVTTAARPRARRRTRRRRTRPARR